MASELGWQDCRSILVVCPTKRVYFSEIAEKSDLPRETVTRVGKKGENLWKPMQAAHVSPIWSSMTRDLREFVSRVYSRLGHFGTILTNHDVPEDELIKNREHTCAKTRQKSTTSVSFAGSTSGDGGEVEFQNQALKGYTESRCPISWMRFAACCL